MTLTVTLKVTKFIHGLGLTIYDFLLVFNSKAYLIFTTYEASQISKSAFHLLRSIGSNLMRQLDSPYIIWRLVLSTCLSPL